MAQRSRISIRRPLTPREIVDAEFDRLSKTLEIGWSKMKDSEAGFVDIARAAVADARRVATDFAAEQDAEAGVPLETLIEQANAGVLGRYIDRHLARQIGLMGLPEEATPDILARTKAAVRSLDTDADLDQQLHESAKSIVSDLQLTAPDWCAPQIETLLRESIGLDGRAPSEEAATAPERARALLRTLDADPSPEPC